MALLVPGQGGQEHLLCFQGHLKTQQEFYSQWVKVGSAQNQ